VLSFEVVEHLRVFQALEAAEVRYLVVGGLAVVLHGHPRFTADIDLVVALDAGNVARVVGVLRAEGFRPRVPVSLDAFAVEEERRRWIDEKGLVALSLWNPSQPLAEIDLFVDAPFDFDACFARSVTLAVAGQRVRVLAREDLVAMKRAAGRPKDLEDALALEALGDRGAS
jgi:hypothetical protein